MKMNTLDALTDVVQKVDNPTQLVGFEPEKYAGKLGGRTIAEVGGEPILFMRHFQRTGKMQPELLGMVD